MPGNVRVRRIYLRRDNNVDKPAAVSRNPISTGYSPLRRSAGGAGSACHQTFRGRMKIKTASGGRHALAEDRLGVFAVLFFTLSAVAPLTVCAGVFPTTYAVTGMTSIPAAM